MPKFKVRFPVLLSVILLVIADTLMYINFAGSKSDIFTPIILFCRYTVLFFLIREAIKSDFTKDIPPFVQKVISLLLIWNIIIIIRGAFKAQDYWDWKFLTYSSFLFLLIPLAIYVGVNIKTSFLHIHKTFKYLFVAGFILIPIGFATNEELYGRIMAPVVFLVLLTPYLSKKWKYLVIGIAILSVVNFLGFRMNIVRMSFSFALLGLFCLPQSMVKSLTKSFYFILILLPLLLTGLALFAHYNLFNEISNIQGYQINHRDGEIESLTGDTRTFLYEEVINSVMQNNSLLIGEGATGKYKSDYFDEFNDGRGRYGSEVGVLNAILYSGLVGVILYALILIGASYHGIFRSNNKLCKMLGLLIAFRWNTYFLEEFTNFDLNFYFFFLIIGLVCSNHFRKLSDLEIKELVRLVFKRPKYYQTAKVFE